MFGSDGTTQQFAYMHLDIAVLTLVCPHHGIQVYTTV